MFKSQISELTTQNSKLVQIHPPCISHPGSQFQNYCLECLEPLCEECIEEHLGKHEGRMVEIKSFKRVRGFCSGRLDGLSGELENRLGMLAPPRTLDQILQESKEQFEKLASTLRETLEQELQNFYSSLLNRITESSSIVESLTQQYNTMGEIIRKLIETKEIVLGGGERVVEKVSEVLSMDENVYLETFARETQSYLRKINLIDFDLNLNINKFRNNIKECLKVGKKEYEEKCEESFDNSAASRTHISRVLSEINLNTPQLFKDKKQNMKIETSENIELTEISPLKILHFFESNSSTLHIYNLEQKKLKKSEIQLPNNYIAPQFHSSLCLKCPMPCLLLSGGVMELGDTEVKSERVSMWVMEEEGVRGGRFIKDFCRIKPRSSHSMCFWGGAVFVLGGYGGGCEDVEIEKLVERIDLETGAVTQVGRSKFGGANISVSMQKGILKASEEGVEFFNVSEGRWHPVRISGKFKFNIGCGWAKINKDTILVYGGYENQSVSLDSCEKWIFNEKSMSLSITNLPYKLPIKEGFLNSEGVVTEKGLYALQNVSSEVEGEESVDVEEGERNILHFNGSKWQVLTL